DDAGVDVALEERGQSEFALCAIRPRALAELLCNDERFFPGLLRQRRIEILVSFALDHQAAETQSIVALHDRIVQVIGEALGHFPDRESWHLAAESIDFCVEGIAAIATSGEQASRFGVERFRANPGFQPSQALGLLYQLLGVVFLRQRGPTDAD